ncbi:LytTR family DNA-binding domain-containing protein [Ascidiimonas aurantiaca]|uniref:LytR/AlgR family response regulator transcription factor n=1 Tax=Ascidiimonas aurantiaca TaxID=1685432 RepID=UPI0030ECCAFF
MIKAVIVEDENIAAERLQRLLQVYTDLIYVDAVIHTLKEAIKYFSKHTPDLIFLDINLTDGSAFEVFNQCKITTPIIFTTAYSEFALNAFEHFSIDYLLKPVTAEKLERSLEKFGSFRDLQLTDYNDLLKAFKKEYRKRFLVKLNHQLYTIPTQEIAYFYSEDKLTFIQCWNGKRYPLDETLKNLEFLVDPHAFFRINKKYLIHSTAIKEMYHTSRSRIKIILKPEPEDTNVMVALEKFGRFKKWLST